VAKRARGSRHAKKNQTRRKGRAKTKDGHGIGLKGNVQKQAKPKPSA
jgi:hypothetical protein